MKKLFLLIFLFININIFSNYITLKKEINISQNSIYLNDIIVEKLNNIPNIFIKNITKSSDIIDSDFIIDKLEENNIYDIIIIGNKTIININKILLDENLKKNNLLVNPLIKLEEIIKSIIDVENYSLNLELIEILPSIDINNIFHNYEWQIKNIILSFNDLQQFMILPIIIDDKLYYAKIKITLDTCVYSAISILSRNDVIKQDFFKIKSIDIMTLQNFENIVFNIDKAINKKLKENINYGDILRWTSLKKTPLLLKGEETKIIFNKNNIEIILPCKLINDGYEDEKIKIKLMNENELYGILRYKKGSIYVEGL